MTAAEQLRGAMVWSSEAPAGRQAYVVFRRAFDLPRDCTSAALAIFADTRYVLWINGQYVERGPCRFDPARPEYDTLDIMDPLHAGTNVIAVLVHHYAGMSFSRPQERSGRFIDHVPGLGVLLDVRMGSSSFTLKTDATWRASATTRFRPGPGILSSVADRIDARMEESDCTGVEFDDASWSTAIAVDGMAWGPFHLRSIPRLRERSVTPKRIIRHATQAGTHNSPVALEKRMPLPLSEGDEVIIDVGEPVAAFIDMGFDADTNSVFEMDYAAQFFDTGNKLRINRDPSPTCYTARSGGQRFMGTDTFGFKYVVIRVRAGKFLLHDITAVERLYPYKRLSRFECDDESLNRLWQGAVRTVELCSEDAHVDCFDRERQQWIADGYLMGYHVSRVTLAGGGSQEPCFGDARLLRNMLRHLALAQLPDGRLPPTAPSPRGDTPEWLRMKHGIIPDYCFLWAQALNELVQRTGDKAIGAELFPVLVKMLDYYLGRRSERGLLHDVDFVYHGGGNPLAYVACEGAALNAFFYGALTAATSLARFLVRPDEAARFEGDAENLKSAYNRHLWDRKVGSYCGALIIEEPGFKDWDTSMYHEAYTGRIHSDGRTDPTGSAAGLALSFDMVPPNRKESVLAYAMQRFEETNPYPYDLYFFIDALYRQGSDAADRLALDVMRRKFAFMVDLETGTTKEQWKRGSVVHEAGAHPAYWLSTRVLGVRTDMTDDGIELVIEPHPGDLQQATGTTLCEFGEVPVSWKRTDQSFAFSLTLPAPARLRLPRANDNREPVLTLNNEIVEYDRLDGRYIELQLAPGRYEGSLKKEEHMIAKHIPEKTDPSLRLFNSRQWQKAVLIEPDGTVVQEWKYDQGEGHKWHYAEMMDNGNLVAVDKGNCVLELDPDSNLVWKFDTWSHHDIARKDDGNTYVLSGRHRVEEPMLPGKALWYDCVYEVTPEGEVVWSWLSEEHVQELQDQVRLPDDYIYGDWPHINTCEILPDSPTAQKDPRFRAGNLLMCGRIIHTIWVVERESGKVVWTWGPGQVIGPHMPTMLPNGHILMYDNGFLVAADARDYTRIIEVDPLSGEIVWEYTADPPQSFFSPSRGSAERLPNGNHLIAESDSGRLFEVAPDGEIVWELLNDEFVDENTRYPYYRVKHYPASQAPAAIGNRD